MSTVRLNRRCISFVSGSRDPKLHVHADGKRRRTVRAAITGRLMFFILALLLRKYRILGYDYVTSLL
jgi:hypothetical protein